MVAKYLVVICNMPTLKHKVQQQLLARTLLFPLLQETNSNHHHNNAVEHCKYPYYKASCAKNKAKEPKHSVRVKGGCIKGD